MVLSSAINLVYELQTVYIFVDKIYNLGENDSFLAWPAREGVCYYRSYIILRIIYGQTCTIYMLYSVSIYIALHGCLL